MAYFRKNLLNQSSFLKEERVIKNTDPMKKFWEYHLKEISKNPICQETGVKIFPEVFSVCHIFPKRKSGGYPSVSSHLANAIYFHVDTHSRFDRLLGELDFDKLEKEFPNSWPEVVEKVKALLPLVKERGKLRDKFEEYLKDK